MVSKGDVLDALRNVYDPEIGINIVDVGLIYRIEVLSEEEAEIDFTLTSPGCPLADTIIEDMKTTLDTRLGLKKVNTNLVWSPPWSIDFMSEEARLDLGYPI
jgi:metal-sulfur cluster biosynthetic enzyme